MQDERRSKSDLIEELKDLRSRIKAFEDLSAKLHVTQQALKESESTYKSIFENTGTAILMIEENTVVSMINAKFAALTGYSREEIEGKKKWTEFVSKNDLPRMLEYHYNRRKTGEKSPSEYEFRLVDKHGDVHQVYIKIGMIPGTQKSIASLIDVTDLKQAKIGIVQSEKQYRTLIDNIPGVVFRALFTKTRNMQLVSDEILPLSGYTNIDFIGNTFKNFDDIIYPDDQAHVRQILEISLSKLNKYEVEYRIVKKDGRINWVFEKGQALKNEKNDRWIEGVILDIQERKKAEEINRTLFAISTAVNTTYNLNDLYESIHKSLNQIIDLKNFFIALYDRVKRTLTFPYYVDEQDDFPAKELFSEETTLTGEVIRRKEPVMLTRSEILKRSSAQNPGYLGTLPEIWLGVPLIVQNQVIGVMATQSYDDPKHFDRQDAKILHSASDQIAIAIDRKMAYEAQRESEKRYRLLLGDIPDPVVVYDAKGNTTYVNETFVKVYGWQKEEIIGKRLDFVPEGEKEHTGQMWQKALAGEKFLFETKRLTKNGQILDIQLKTALFYDKQGQHIESIVIHRDISELKRAEEAMVEQLNERRIAEEKIRKLNEELEQRVAERTAQLEASNKSLERAVEQARQLARDAKAANIAKSQFLANMSHEICTPMNAIIGMCDLSIETNLNPKQAEYLESIRSSSHSLLGIINDILDFSKIEAGRLDFEHVPFSLREHIEEISNIFISKLSKKDIELVIDIDPDVPKRLVGDPMRLRQVLVNLMSNAVKFTDTGEICLGVQIRSVTQNTVELLFSVKDTGIGIETETKSKLFDTFTQADASTTRKYGGTGLGLAICKKIVSIMGGEIWAESSLGQGSAFYFTANFSSLVEKEPILKHIPQGLHRMKTLIVEDNPATQQIIKRYVDSFGFRSSVVASGEDALEIIRNTIPDDRYELILMDVGLPGMDGIQTSEKIRQIIENGKVPQIIITSAHGTASDIARARRAGIDGYLVKPIKPSILFDTIMEIFGYRILSDELNTSEFSDLDDFSELKILLVEDNPVNRRVTVELLKNTGIKVEMANNGLEALDAVESNHYDGVFMDVQMPVMDGYEATMRIRNQLKLKDLPIIAMTAHATSADKDRCIESGMNDYLTKPIVKNELFDKIRTNILRKAQIGINPDSMAWVQFFNEAVETGMSLGVDLVSGLKQVANSWDVYSEIILSLCRSQKDFIDRIDRLIRQKDYAGAKYEAHTLKGAAGNISARELEIISRKLDQALAQEDETKSRILLLHVKQALDRLDEFYDKILLKKFSEHRKATYDIKSKMNLLDLLKQLDQVLSEFDPVQSDPLVQKIRQTQYAAQNQEVVTELEEEIHNYHYDRAREIINRIMTKIGKP